MKIPVSEVLNVYLREHAPSVARVDFLHATAKPLADWWDTKWLTDVHKRNCAEYVSWRTATRGMHGRTVSVATARHDLKTLRAAIRYFHATYGPLPSLPVVTLPPKAPAKTDWLTRSQVARMLWQAKTRAWADRRRFGSRVNTPYTANHLTRFILIGVYTGSRPGRVLALRWTPSVEAGHVDLERRVIYRKAAADDETRKRAPMVRIHDRLLPWLRRWRAIDKQLGQDIICHWQGAQVDRLDKSWDTARDAAGIAGNVTPHVVRHTCTTWLLQAGVPVWEVAGFVGMSEATVREVYGHHSPEWQRNAASATNKRKQ